MKISIFIDYDNMSCKQKKMGLKCLIQHILGFDDFSPIKRGECVVRLYGGWYEEDRLTCTAEKLISEVQDDFPTIMKVKGVQFNTKIELAFAMSETPTDHLFGTYRKKQFPSNVRCSSPTTLGCVDDDCPLKLLKKFIAKKKCSKDGCDTDVSKFMYRNEQKLVDTMLSCDILYTQKVSPESQVYVVSSDDDILPAIKTLNYRGTRVTRVHTKNSRNMKIETRHNKYNERILL